MVLWFDVDGPAMRERPTVVLLHGGPGSFDHTYFKPEFARLTAVAQVFYLDLNGPQRAQTFRLGQAERVELRDAVPHNE